MNNSDNLYTNHLDSKETRWFAVYTKFRSEKFVTQQLRKRGVETYLPLITSTKRYKSKTRVTELPLINHYVFVKIKKEEYVSVLSTPGVVSFLKLGKGLVSVPEEEIQVLKRIVGENISLTLEDWIPYPGDEVEIIAGNLTGLKGYLVSQENNKNFVVQLSSLGLQYRIAIDMKNLTPLRTKRRAV